MNKLATLTIALLCAGVLAQADILTRLTSRAAQNPTDILDWGSQLPELTPLFAPFSVNTFNGNSVLVSPPFGFGEMEVLPTVVPSSAVTQGWYGNFDFGESVLWNAPNGVTGPITLELTNPVNSFGFQIQQQFWGCAPTGFSCPFIGSVQALGAGNVVLDTLFLSGTSSNLSNGSALFMGLLDHSGDHIYGIRINTIDPSGFDSGDFAINDVSFSNDPPGVPEPGFLPLLAVAFLCIAVASHWKKSQRCGRA